MKRTPQAAGNDAPPGGPGEWIRPEIQALSAYHVPSAAGLIKLDAMENPYTWPEPVVDEWLEALREVSLNRYPDPASGRLKQRLCRIFGVPDGTEVMLGNGSDELIQMVLLAVSQPGRCVVAPQPAFSMYRMISIFAGLEFHGVPLRADLELDVDAMLAAIKRYRPAAIFIDYPNNPTGRLFERDALVAIIEAAPGFVVIDEAYHVFADASFMPMLPHYRNLLILRTLSKMGLAGLRLGLLAGASEWLGQFNKIRLPYNINVLAQASADFALNHQDLFDEQGRAIREDRDRLYEDLSALPGITAYPSRANFILFRVPDGRAGPIYQSLLTHGVLIKNLHGAGPLLEDCLRVTVGKPEENRAFLQALGESLQQS